MSKLSIHSGRIVMLASATIALTGFAAPSQAADKTAASTADTSAASGGGDGASQPDNKKYCVVERFTGSYLPHKTCKTKGEWSDEGIDISKSMK